MKIKRLLTAGITVFLLASSASADWQVPVSVTGGTTTVDAVIGMEKNATNGYDPGRDVPVLEKGAITPLFSHPEWGVSKGGSVLNDFYQDIKGDSYPAVWEMAIDTSVKSDHTISWSIPDELPVGFRLYLYPPQGGEVDMLKTANHTFTPSALTTFRIEALLDDAPIPLAPEIKGIKPMNKALHVEWDLEDESAIGYRIHFGKESGDYYRTIDVKKATNLKIKKLVNGNTYFIAVSAYNADGVEGNLSEEVTGVPLNIKPTSPLIGFQGFESGSDIDLVIGDSRDGDDESLIYSAEIYSDRKLEDRVAAVANLEGASWKVGPLPDGIYYWWARAYDGTDYGSWSGVRVFRVGTPEKDNIYMRKRY